MNRREWGLGGYHVILRDGFVYLHPMAKFWGRTWRTPINSGRWMQHDLTSAAWEAVTPSNDPPLAAIAAFCYCSSGFERTGCDFCTGTRLIDGEERLRSETLGEPTDLSSRPI